jgi:hypothetical protein
MSTHKYKTYTIIKSDTGGRRLGREVWYQVEGGITQHTTLKGIKTVIDIKEKLGRKI